MLETNYPITYVVVYPTNHNDDEKSFNTLEDAVEYFYNTQKGNAVLYAKVKILDRDEHAKDY